MAPPSSSKPKSISQLRKVATSRRQEQDEVINISSDEDESSEGGADQCESTLGLDWIGSGTRRSRDRGEGCMRSAGREKECEIEVGMGSVANREQEEKREVTFPSFFCFSSFLLLRITSIPLLFSDLHRAHTTHSPFSCFSL